MRLYIVGTFDTKAEELNYAADIARAAGVAVTTVDVGTREAGGTADIANTAVAAFHPQGKDAVLSRTDRGQAVSAMAEALALFLKSRDDIGGILGLGGTGNTALVTHAMRQLPVGVPKLMLSTVGSGNTAPYVGPNDIAMMHSVVDIAGLNAISRPVIANAAAAAAGMVKLRAPGGQGGRPTIGMTMFGVTTPCVTRLREALDADFDAAVFHATGTGGQAMEKLADSGFFRGLIDVTTTEVADYLVGGVFACTEDRFGAAIRTKLPYVGSLGAVDMVNFGAPETVPEKFAGRKFHVHNAQVTLMRTTPEENRVIGAFIVERLNRMEGPVRFLIPLQGVSALDAEGQPFFDPEADAALFDTIRTRFEASESRRLIERDNHINDPAFVDALADHFLEILKEEPAHA